MEQTVPTRPAEAAFSETTSKTSLLEQALSGTSLAITASPLVALPMVSGAITLGSTSFFFASSAFVTVTAPALLVGGLAVGATTLVAGQAVRAKIKAKQVDRLKTSIIADCHLRLLSSESTTPPSFKQSILADVGKVAGNLLQNELLR